MALVSDQNSLLTNSPFNVTIRSAFIQASELSLPIKEPRMDGAVLVIDRRHAKQFAGRVLGCHDLSHTSDDFRVFAGHVS
jgi:hypothetical protein